MRRRVEGICVAADADLASLGLQVITAPGGRLDLHAVPLGRNIDSR